MQATAWCLDLPRLEEGTSSPMHGQCVKTQKEPTAQQSREINLNLRTGSGGNAATRPGTSRYPGQNRAVPGHPRTHGAETKAESSSVRALVSDAADMDTGDGLSGGTILPSEAEFGEEARWLPCPPRPAATGALFGLIPVSMPSSVQPTGAHAAALSGSEAHHGASVEAGNIVLK